jgi:aminoglycoside 2'-N-acetyltransferase I
VIRTAHTSEVDEATRAAARALLYDAFPGEMTEDDWEHCLGGIHALAYEDGELVGHAAVVQRRLLYAGRALRTGYVEGVAVRAGQRRRGHGAALITALEPFIRGGYDLGALGATDEGSRLYAAHGWRRWEGPLSSLTLEGLRRRPEQDGDIWVLETGVPLDVTWPLACDWRDGDLW